MQAEWDRVGCRPGTLRKDVAAVRPRGCSGWVARRFGQVDIVVWWIVVYLHQLAEGDCGVAPRPVRICKDWRCHCCAQLSRTRNSQTIRTRLVYLNAQGLPSTCISNNDLPFWLRTTKKCHLGTRPIDKRSDITNSFPSHAPWNDAFVEQE